MEQQILDDLQIIFKNQIEPSIMLRLNDCFDLILDRYPKTFRIKTRNEKHDILSYQGKGYFSIVQISNEIPVVFAGALEKNIKGIVVPVIRFRDENSSLQNVSNAFKFPYRKPNWTYVQIHKNTIEYIADLFIAQINYHLKNYSAV